MVLVLTGQGASQNWSRQPGEQMQVPLAGSQAAPLAHSHVWLQPSPQVPLEQGMEQSTPCQPGPEPESEPESDPEPESEPDPEPPPAVSDHFWLLSLVNP